MKISNVVIRGSLMAVTLSAFSLSAHADPCDNDRVTTCNDTVPGDGKVFDCMMGRKDRVKPECAKALDRANELTAHVVASCKADAHRWCAQYSADGHRAIIDCLRQKKDQVNEACKRSVRQFQAFGFDIRS